MNDVPVTETVAIAVDPVLLVSSEKQRSTGVSMLPVVVDYVCELIVTLPLVTEGSVGTSIADVVGYVEKES